jgi:3',5'-nucleoside bisphosphate phosphatase
VIDLHLHTTASDGRSSSAQLVEEAWDVGIRVMSVTDHDTMAGLDEAAACAASRGMTFVPGIEITSVFEGRDVHILAYGLHRSAPSLDTLISRQRALRLERAKEIASRLDRAGAPIDLTRLLEAADGMAGKSIARPQIARLLCDAGHIATVAEAFDKYLGEGCSGYVPHTGASPSEVIALVRREGGVPSMAHPGVLNRDELIASLVASGLPCLEVYHSAHDGEAVERYRVLAQRYGLVCTGGSDYHGPGTRRAENFGRVSLPPNDFEKLAVLLSQRSEPSTVPPRSLGSSERE